jgi:hypothetical protein
MAWMPIFFFGRVWPFSSTMEAAAQGRKKSERSPLAGSFAGRGKDFPPAHF